MPEPLLVTGVAGGNVHDEDDPNETPSLVVHALYLRGFRMNGGGPDEVVAVVDINGAASIIAGLRLMFADDGLARELAEQVRLTIVNDKRGRGR